MKTDKAFAWIFGLLSFIFLICVFCFAPPVLDSSRQNILAVIASILAAAFGFFLSGSLKLDANINIPGANIAVKSTAAIALFIFSMMWWKSEKAPVKSEEQFRKEILYYYQNVVDDLAMARENVSNMSRFDSRLASLYGEYLSLPGGILPISKNISENDILFKSKSKANSELYYIPAESQHQLCALVLSTLLPELNVSVMGRNTVVNSVKVDGPFLNTPALFADENYVFDLSGHNASIYKITVKLEKPIMNWNTNIAKDKSVSYFQLIDYPFIRGLYVPFREITDETNKYQASHLDLFVLNIWSQNADIVRDANVIAGIFMQDNVRVMLTIPKNDIFREKMREAHDR